MTSDIFVLVEHIRGKLEEITYVSLAAGNQIAEAVGGKVVAVLIGHEAEHLTQDLTASKVLSVDHPNFADFSPDAYLQILTTLLKEHQPHAFITGHTSVGMDLVCGLAVRLNQPVISQCQKVIFADGKLHFRSQICGGKIIAEGVLPEKGVLISMVPGGFKPIEGKSDSPPPVEAATPPALDDIRVKLLEYIEPDLSDVDISKEEVLFAVGRGLRDQNGLELVKTTAKLIGGTVCASRPIIDQGWLMTSRLVGKSGKSVSPKLYLALGISGAPEHLEGITESDLIIAVNTDPNAPIFDIAQYGVETDLVDFLEALNEQLQ
jgi:electron transfer flavoprotein alpha subunit